YLTTKVAGGANKDKVKITVTGNTIKNNAQYASSQDSWDVAAGMTFSVKPKSYQNNLKTTYETAYKVGDDGNVVEYQKAVYTNNQQGTAGVLTFSNNYIGYNYNNSDNPGGVAIRNFYDVKINETVEEKNKIVQGNFTAGGGAAFEFFRNFKTRVHNTIFKNNNSLTKGGAVSIVGENDIEFINQGTKEKPTVEFSNNYARTFGGAVYVSDAIKVKFTNVAFKNNYLLSGKRWVTTMGLADFYTNWYYGYQNGTIRKGYPSYAPAGGWAETFETYDAFTKKYGTKPNASATVNKYYYVKQDDAIYYCTTSKDKWLDDKEAWEYYTETQIAAKRGFIEPYLWGDKAASHKVYTKRLGTESMDAIFHPQSIEHYEEAIGGWNANMGKGGAISLISEKKTNMIFDGCDFTGNQSSYTAGAIYANTDAGKILIYGSKATRSNVENNISGRSGGFMVVENTLASLSYVNVKNNRSEQGGAIFTFTDPDKSYSNESTQLYIDHTDFVNNTFLSSTDMTPYEDYVDPIEDYDYSMYSHEVSGGGELTNDAHNYKDI
ncbi:MAG: hypothetical protein II411_04415, partial [Lachnospiraceae bacterium]|nr:hypothetical protein [Lachnospiraceae bacterium]